MSRRSARGQQLPPQEVELLNSLTKDQRVARVYDLFNAGWSLQNIGDALQPKHPKTTVRTWVQRAESSSNNLQRVDAPIPAPKFRTPEGGYQKKRPEPSEIPQETLEIIQELAPIARSYRAKMASTSAAAVANDRLTAICILEYQRGVAIKDLARAAGVTYRAMYKRIKL